MPDQSADSKRMLAPVEAPRQQAQPKYLQIRDYWKYQHYKERRPPWVKLHGAQLEDYEFQQLPDATRFHALCLTWLASRTDNKIPFDANWVASRMGLHEPINLEGLIRFGFLEPWRPRLQEPGPGEQMPLPADSAAAQVNDTGTPAPGDASNLLAPCKQSASTETETETEAETHTETDTGPASAGRRCSCCGQTVFSKYTYAEALTLAEQWKREGKIIKGRPVENPGGLATKLHQLGTADTDIEELKRPRPPKREFLDTPCSVCFGGKSEVVQSKGARPCPHCVDEQGQRTGREPKQT